MQIEELPVLKLRCRGQGDYGTSSVVASLYEAGQRRGKKRGVETRRRGRTRDVAISPGQKECSEARPVLSEVASRAGRWLVSRDRSRHQIVASVKVEQQTPHLVVRGGHVPFRGSSPEQVL